MIGERLQFWDSMSLMLAAKPTSCCKFLMMGETFSKIDFQLCINSLTLALPRIFGVKGVPKSTCQKLKMM